MTTTLSVSQISSMLLAAGSTSVIGQTNKVQIGYLLGLLQANYSSVVTTTSSNGLTQLNFAATISSLGISSNTTAGAFETFALSNGQTF